MKKLLHLFTENAMVFGLLFFFSNANLSLAQSTALTAITGGSNFVFNNQGFTVGYEFTTNQTITVSQLGFYDQNDDGFATAHNVGIYNLCGTLLASASIPSGTSAGHDNGFRYVTISDLVLAAGTYRIGGVVFNGGGNDAFRQGVSTVTTNGNITYSKGVINNGVATLQYPFQNATVTGLQEKCCFGPNFKFTVGGTPPGAPEINVQGNSNDIADGSTAPSAPNNTDFGNAINNIGKSKNFTIQNSGTADLTISSINFGGTNAANFSYSGITLPATVAPSGSTTFTVIFNPTSSGSKTATINIGNNDCDENPYDFSLSGTGTNTYSFTGSGDWSNSANWDVALAPPNPLVTGLSVLVNGSATCTMDASKTINSGATLTVNAGATLQITGSFTLTNNGTMTINGALSKTSANSGLVNSATGSITVPSGGALYNSSGSFSNAGTLTTNSGGNFDSHSGNFTNTGTYNNGGLHTSTYGSFSNSGTITNTGTMNSGQYIHIGNSGSWTNSPGGSMSMNSFINSGASASLTNNGTMNVGLTNSNTFENNGTFTTSYFSQTNNSGATWTNKLGATFTTTGTPFSNAGTFHNLGTITMNQISGLASFANSGTFNSSGDITLSTSLPGTNSGTFNVNGGTFTISGTFTNNGTLDNMSAVVLNATFKGSGTLVQSGTFTNNSTSIIAPGGSPGTLSVTGDFALGSSTYQCEIAGTTQGSTYDLLAVSGTATLGISSKLHLIFSVPVVNGTTFDILTANALSGTFGTVTFANTGAGNATAVSVTYPGGNKVRATVTSLLPVELVLFSGKEVEGKVLLNWETSSELNNEVFRVERSTDGIRWEEIGAVEGHGTTAETHHYSFFDENPVPNENYYRLRQVDFDGKAELSKVVSVDLSGHPGAEAVPYIYPNPVKNGELSLLLPADFEENIQVKLFDSVGRLLRSATIGGGANLLDVNGLAKGLYLLHVNGFVVKIVIAP